MPKKEKIPVEKLTVIREKVDYLTLRLNVNSDICRYLDILNDADSVRVFDIPRIRIIHESEILGKLHVLRIQDYMGNSLGSVQLARPGAIGFFSELHLQGNFWFLCGMEQLPQFLELFERSMNDELGIAHIDYCIDVSEPVEILQRIFQRINSEKGKRQPKNSEYDTYQSINSRRLKTIYYDKKLDIAKAKDKAGLVKYDLVIESGEYPYRDYYESERTITRIEQTRKGESLREQKHSIAWYLSPAGIRSLTLEDLEKKGIGFDAPERMRIRYEKKNEEWKELSESVIEERKEHSKKMFLAYAKSLNRFGLLREELGKMTDFLTIEEFVSMNDTAIRKEMDRIFY